MQGEAFGVNLMITQQMSGAINEAQTRARQIDPQLRAADWKLNDRTQVRLEVPVDGYDAEPWNGVTDYCLYDASGNVLAVVEAKRCSRNAREADEQLRHYVTEIAKKQSFAPFGFMANGHDIWFWEVGLANPRLVAGFFTPADLERLKFLRQNRGPTRGDLHQQLHRRPSLPARGHSPRRRGLCRQQAPRTSRHGYRHGQDARSHGS